MLKLPENTEYKSAVGAVITCTVDGKKCTILQKRPQLKEDGTPESYPGCLQVTVHGGLEVKGLRVGTNRKERERMIVGLQREMKEEIMEMLKRSNVDEGRMTLTFFSGVLSSFKAKALGILSRSRKTTIPSKLEEGIPVRKTDVTLGFDITERIATHPQLRTAILQMQNDGVVVLLSADQLDNLVPLDPKLHKKDGLQENGKYGMFADEIEAVTRALRLAQ